MAKIQQWYGKDRAMILQRQSTTAAFWKGTVKYCYTGSIEPF